MKKEDKSTLLMLQVGQPISRRDTSDDDYHSRGDHTRSFSERSNGSFRGNDRRGGRRSTIKLEANGRENIPLEESENIDKSSLERAESCSSIEAGSASRRRRRQKSSSQAVNGTPPSAVKLKTGDVKHVIEKTQNKKEFVGGKPPSLKAEKSQTPKGRRPKNKMQENLITDSNKDLMVNGSSAAHV